MLRVAVEQAKIGQVAARLMERLEQEYETDKSAEVSSVNLISAVRHDAGERLTFISTRAHAWHSPRVCSWSSTFTIRSRQRRGYRGYPVSPVWSRC
jgi:hypothetical protein